MLTFVYNFFHRIQFIFISKADSMMSKNMDQFIRERAEKWLTGDYDEQTKKQVKYLMDNDINELTESFYKDLEFGTGGLRGIMGVGTNRMNIYTVGMATQGLANYLKKAFPNKQIRVAIGHDSRNNSRLFSERVADIFSANGFKVYLFDSLRPTPELSFAIRKLECDSGVVITASHNPKEYNGYKAYWNDGAQVVAPHDKNIIAEVQKITSPDQVLTGGNKSNITILDETFDEIYLDAIHSLSLSPQAIEQHSNMKIVYTPIHGTGVILVPKSLRKFGFTRIITVKEQNIPDGNFPTVASPNPEERATMNMAIDLAAKEQAELVLATDPRCRPNRRRLTGQGGQLHPVERQPDLLPARVLYSKEVERNRAAQRKRIRHPDDRNHRIGLPHRRIVRCQTLRMPDRFQIHRNHHAQPRRQDAIHLWRRGELRFPCRRLCPGQRCCQRLLAGR